MDQVNDLLARLEKVEERARELDLAFAWQASRAAPAGPAVELAGLQAQADAHTLALAALRDELHTAREEHARQLATLQAALDAARAKLPGMIAAAKNEAAPDRQDAVRRQVAFMHKRLREQFDATVEEHTAARTKVLQTELVQGESALVAIQKQAAANDARLKELQATFADLALEAARIPERRAAEERSRLKTWRAPALAVAVLLLGLVAWQASKRMGGLAAGAPPSDAVLLDQAGEAAVRKDYARAESLYREVLKRNPSQEEALRGLGNSLMLDSEAVLHTLPPP